MKKYTVIEWDENFNFVLTPDLSLEAALVRAKAAMLDGKRKVDITVSEA